MTPLPENRLVRFRVFVRLPGVVTDRTVIGPINPFNYYKPDSLTAWREKTLKDKIFLGDWKIVLIRALGAEVKR
jgi:hypothetical protein